MCTPSVQRAQRRDLRGIAVGAAVAVDLRGVGLADDGFQVRRRNVGDELGQHREREVGIGQLAPGIQFGARHLRILLRQIQAAVRRETAQQNFGERLGGRIAAGGDVFHLDARFVSIPSPVQGDASD